MSIGTTGDAETIRKLGETIAARAGDTGAWDRLAVQLRGQRALIGYGNRRRFVRERCDPDHPGGLDYKFIYDLEKGLRGTRRKAYPVGRMPRVAAAYMVTLGSISDVLDGAGDLVPLPPADAPLPADPPPAVRMSGVLSETALAAAAPYATRILLRLRDLAHEPATLKPAGHEVFAEHPDARGRLVPADDRAASVWDAYADDMPEPELVWLIAALQADADTPAARPDTNVG